MVNICLKAHNLPNKQDPLFVYDVDVLENTSGEPLKGI